MKILFIAAAVAATSASACLVPSLSRLDKRLASVGVDPAPYRWGIEAQLRIADERKVANTVTGADGKEQTVTDVPKRTFVWASAPTRTSTSRQPTIGDVTRAATAVRIGVEASYTITGVPSQHAKAVAEALSYVSGTVDAATGAATVSLHGVDCSQRKVGWSTLACDVELGDGGKTLLTLSGGKVDKASGGVLKGAVTHHDPALAAVPAANAIRYALLCDSEEDEDEKLGLAGKAAVRAFAVVLTIPDATNSIEEDHNSNNNKGATHERVVELVLRFSQLREAALSSSEDGGAPTTVVGADGVAVYLLRGSTVLGRWVLPLVYAIALLVALPYMAQYVTKLLQPKPSPAGDIHVKGVSKGTLAPTTAASGKK